MLRPHIIVAGFARCGTTLTMHMLHAAGVACIGETPGFEVREISGMAVSRDFLFARFGHAFKLLDPHILTLPAGMPRTPVIWLDRNPVQQARSQAKFAHMVGGMPMANRDHLRRWAAGLKEDRPRALRRFAGWPVLTLQFEGLIEAPRNSAALIARFLNPWWHGLDHEAMAAKVLPRSTDCQPGVDIEMRLSEEAGA